MQSYPLTHTMFSGPSSHKSSTHTQSTEALKAHQSSPLDALTWILSRLCWGDASPVGLLGLPLSRKALVEPVAFQAPVHPGQGVSSLQEAPDGLEVTQRCPGVQERLGLGYSLFLGPLTTVLGMLLQVLQHHVAVTADAPLSPSTTVVLVLLELVESQLQVTVLAGHSAQGTLQSLGQRAG